MLALTQAMIHAWTLKPRDYLTFAEQELLDLLIDAGFIFAYEAVALQLRLHGRAPTARQDSVAQNISQSALRLLTEVLADDPGAQPRSQTRIFGLLATLTNSRTELPADLARDIPFSREAIDCITTAAFSYRAHHTLAELSKVLDRSDIHTPTLRSVLHTVKGFKSPMQHRFEEISGSRPSLICIDERMEEALKRSSSIAALIHDGRINEAADQAKESLARFPSLLEFHWWRNQLCQEQPPNADEADLDLDASLGCNTHENSRSVQLWKTTLPNGVKPGFVISCVHRLERPLDQDARAGLLRCCQALTARFELNEEQERLHRIRENMLTIGADFDPFFLTLLKTGISSFYQQNKPTHEAIASNQEAASLNTPKLYVLTGLPSPLLQAPTLIQRGIEAHGQHKILISEMKLVDRAMLDSAYMQSSVYTYPEVVQALTPEHINSARQFYLQNLSFMDPVGNCDSVLHVNQDAFTQIALLERIFKSITVIEVLPDLDHWISHSLAHMSGYNCDFAIPSEPELIAYASDYFEIMGTWRSALDIPFYTLQHGHWLGKIATPAEIPEALLAALPSLDQHYNGLRSSGTESSTSNTWGKGDDGAQLRALAKAYTARC
jgi:hypothetical protein